MNKIDTFSAHSLKILEKDKKEFSDKILLGLSFYKSDKRANLGNKYHALMCFYIKGFDIERLMADLDKKERELFQNFLLKQNFKKENFIKTEYPFLIKENLENKPYYLTGRFDAIYQEEDRYIIYDWKTLNIPKDPVSDLQTVVYLYCASEIFNTDKIKMRYISIERGEFIDIEFQKREKYKKRIDEIVTKYYLS